jgi:hypothetical protein
MGLSPRTGADGSTPEPAAPALHRPMAGTAPTHRFRRRRAPLPSTPYACCLESAASSARACRIAADLANWVAEHMPELSAKPGKTPASSRPLVRHQWRVRWRSPAAGARAQLESDWRPPRCCPEAALARSVMTPHQLDVARATITSGPLLVERSRVSLAGPAGASRRAVGRVSHAGLCPCSRPEARRSVRCPC